MEHVGDTLQPRLPMVSPVSLPPSRPLPEEHVDGILPQEGDRGTMRSTIPCLRRDSFISELAQATLLPIESNCKRLCAYREGDRTLAESQRRGASFPSVRFNHHKTDFGAPSSDGLLSFTTSTEGSLTVAIVLTVLTVNMASTLEKGEVRQDQEMEIATPTKEVGAFVQSYTEEQEKKGECRFYGSCCTVMK